MKRTYQFAEPTRFVATTTEAGEPLELPLIAGILKHPTEDQLAELLADPIVAKKYTCTALRVASSHALARFPRWWLIACLPDANLPDARRKALEFLLGTG